MNTKPMILIVDDIAQNIQTLGMMLKKHQYEIAAAIGPYQALELLNDRIPDLILLDIMMPEIDGLQLCKQLKSEQKYAKIPVIFLTAKTDPETILNAFNAGGVDYIEKPFRSEELLARLKTHLELKKSRDTIIEINQTLQKKITKQEKTELALHETLDHLRYAKSQVEHVAKSKQSFLAKISHEIRTPINAIIGMGKLLETTPISSEQQEYIETIKTSANHLFGLINNILDFSKIEAGKLELEQRLFSLKELLKTTDKIVRNSAQKKGLSLTIKTADNLPEQFEGDLIRLRQILVNLLNNSIKFTNKGSIELSISSSPNPQNAPQEELFFKVTDTGIGIPPEKQTTLFEAFTQIDQSISRHYGGTGLGLSIVKELVELMGGKIWIENNPPQGTIFLFTVQLIKHQNGIDLPQKCSSPKILPKKTVEILLVEDNEINIKVANKFLTRMNFNITTARNGLKALEILNQKKFDLILMDIEMPEMDGLETTLHIRNHPPENNSKDIPIIAMTAHAITTFKDKCFNVGMNGYITKPVDFNHLQALISKTLTIPSRPTSMLNEKETLKRLFGDRALLLELYNIFLEEIPEKQSSMEHALLIKDRDQFKKIAHSLISLTGAIGAEPPRLKALKLEQISPKESWDQLQYSHKKLFQDIAIVIKEIKQQKDQV